MAFELTVSLGDIVATTGFIVTAVGAVMAVRSNLTVLTTTVDLTNKQNEERFVRISAPELCRYRLGCQVVGT